MGWLRTKLRARNEERQAEPDDLSLPDARFLRLNLAPPALPTVPRLVRTRYASPCLRKSPGFQIVPDLPEVHVHQLHERIREVIEIDDVGL